MKIALYKSLYSILLTLTNRFNNRLLSTFKIFLGTSLLLIMSSCLKKEKEEDEIMCYAVGLPQESMVIEPE